MLTVKNLTLLKKTETGTLTLVDGVSFEINKGDSVGLIGESGSGKTLTALALMRLLDADEGWNVKGSVTLNENELMNLSEKKMHVYRGRGMAMIFQDPLNALNPVLTCGEQIAEAFRNLSLQQPAAAKDKVINILAELDIEQPLRVYKAYPHELSGGMRQRVMTAIALSCGPDLLIADEPGSMLDYENKLRFIGLIRRYNEKKQCALLFITHDFGMISGFDQIMVMYASRLIETGSGDVILSDPNHPYSKSLLSLKELPSSGRMTSIPGTILSPANYKTCCHFADRCVHAMPICSSAIPAIREISQGHFSACFLNEK